jgi:ATP-dependent protease ClpP protease subunit
MVPHAFLIWARTVNYTDDFFMTADEAKKYGLVDKVYS